MSGSSRRSRKPRYQPYKYSPGTLAAARKIYGPKSIPPGLIHMGPTAPTTPGAASSAPATAPGYLGYLSPAQIRSQAQADANLAYAPQASELARLKAEELARATKQAQAIQGFTTAAAQMMQGAGPAVQAGYQSAARDQSAFAKGFSDATAHLAQQGADQSNQILSNLGNTGTPVQGDTGAANVLYGLGGYIPASTLEREGAAYSAQAAAYPRATLGEGAIAFRGTLAQGETAARGFDERLAALGPQKRQTIANYIFREKQRQAQLEQGSITARQNAAFKEVDYALKQRALEINAGYLAVTTAKTQGQMDAGLSQQYGYIFRNGKPVVGADGNHVPTAAQANYDSAQARYDANFGETVRHHQATEATSAAKTTASGQGKHAAALKGRSSAWADLDKYTVTRGRSGRGKPVTNPNFGKGPTAPYNKFQYLTADGTGTNDPKKAATSGRVNGDKVLTEVYQAMGSILETRYGVPKQRVLNRIRAKLRSLGYKV